MKLLIASDIHGDIKAARKIIEVFESKGCTKILLLGDVLYHGPRNDLPKDYSPKEVIELLNGYSDKILAVRGNCDTEVDQMVLNFPVLADYAVVSVDDITFYASHGHKYNMQTPPPLAKWDVLLNGHTHIYEINCFGNENLYINVGSIALPKGGNPKTYAIYQNHAFSIFSDDDECLVTTMI